MNYQSDSSSTMPRLPSFQQLNETLRQPDFSDHTSKFSRFNNGEYSYGHHERHESFPNQYIYPNLEAAKQLFMFNKIESSTHSDSTFINDLIQFLIDFESKYNDAKDSPEVIEKLSSDICGQRINDTLNNLRRMMNIIENIKMVNDSKKKFAKKQIQNQKKIRKKLQKFSSDMFPIDIKSSDQQEVQFQGGLNSELSMKSEIICQHCCSQETPEWRRGPEGSRTLCNACGLFYSKLIKKHGLQEADKVMMNRKQTGTVNDRRIF